jgi:hypothetical protein
MSNVVPFPHHTMTESSAVSGETQSMQDLRARAARHFYAAERSEGASPALAAERTEFFITRRFEGLIDNIRDIMAERG